MTATPVIFIVEDTPDTAMIFAFCVQAIGGIAHTASTGEEFLTWLETHPEQTIDVVLLDLRLPGQDGYHILKHLAASPHYHHMRVIAITGDVFPEDIDKIQLAGFHGFIRKPIYPAALKQALRQILAGETVWLS